MPMRRSAAAQPDAVSRRLSLLSAELAAVRETAAGDGSEAEPHTRIRMRSALPDAHTPVPEQAPLPPETPAPALPAPGRHASRQVGVGMARQLADRMPDTMHGRVRLSPTQLTLVALLVAIGLAATAWWSVRSGTSGAPVQAAFPGPATPVSGLGTPGPFASPVGSPAPTTGAPTGAVTLVVDVTGAVHRPGIVVLDSGSRVVDALEAAGGAKRGADLSSLNQARLIVDGEQIVVGVPGAPGVAASAAASATATTLININTATETDLEELPGVGPVTAQAIIDWRSANGGFTSVDELLEVDGIGDATLADLAPYVTL